MGFFDLFRKPKVIDSGAALVNKSGLPSISYAIAYLVLPQGVFNDCDKFITMWTDGVMPAGPVFYHLGCQFHQVEPVREHQPLFQASHGQLDDATDYYLMEYPVPPRLDFLKMFPGKNLAEAEVPVPAPFFSAMLRNRQTGAVSYYVLGQAPVGGGTTLRSVTQEGVNCNLGAGPEPRAEKFLETLRAKTHAAV